MPKAAEDDIRRTTAAILITGWLLGSVAGNCLISTNGVNNPDAFLGTALLSFGNTEYGVYGIWCYDVHCNGAFGML